MAGFWCSENYMLSLIIRESALETNLHHIGNKSRLAFDFNVIRTRREKDVFEPLSKLEGRLFATFR